MATLAMHRASADPTLPRTIDFNRDIRPIFSENCYACHGPDKNKRKGHLRLDSKDGIFSEHNGLPTVVPGKPDSSELFRRVTTTDDTERMPDPKSGKHLAPRQIALLKKWIEQGAVWKGHWAYLKVVRSTEPTVDQPGIIHNPIDRFILAKIKEAGLTPSPEADRVTLIRRLSFDLLGLPPTRAEVEAFVNDTRPDAYEQLVDRLLASPHYGERMAMYWLDLVRYADSIGYHSDNPMHVSPYRDYVIRAFNSNKWFDQFTIEQLAGDLLPGATIEQKVASGYNRLLQTTEEGGAQAKEYEAKYAADRVRNVSTVWLGTTMGCCQCHDHKFDPFTQKDFYSLAAFFADVQETAVGRREDGMPVPSPEQAAQLREFERSIARLKAQLEAPNPKLDAAQAEWEKRQQVPASWQVLQPIALATVGGTKLARLHDGAVMVKGTAPARDTYTITARTPLHGITGFRLDVLDDKHFAGNGPGASNNGNFVLTEFKVSAALGDQPAQLIHFRRASADFEQKDFPVAHAIDGKNDTGWAIYPQVGRPHTAIFEPDKPVGTEGEIALTIVLDHQSIYMQHSIGKFRLSVTASPHPAAGRELPPNLRAVLAITRAKRSEQQKHEVAAYYRNLAPELADLRAEIARYEKRKADVLKRVPTCLVSISVSPRVVHLLPRGNWLDESGPVVQPALPQSLVPAHLQGSRATRLDLAKWIVSRDNPLTARAFTNRLWKLFFGQGLSKILDDLGSQGEWPTHPELLDWLAVEFMDSGWDVKHMVRLLVTSGTYRQSSHPRSELKEADPYNRLVARQTPFRLDAEMVRDSALAISGLLSDKIGGPSVFPYQPPGYWAALNFPPREWHNDKGEKLYRRGMYTHWQRSFPHPSLLAFDAPSREECTCERARSNIPQQALVLLNDPTYVEAARVFAERIIKEGGTSVDERLTWAFTCALSRNPRPEEMHILAELFAKHAREYSQDVASAQQLLTSGDHPASKNLNTSQLAAWTSVARAILNLHEAITRN
jgi:hypothetical protein